MIIEGKAPDGSIPRTPLELAPLDLQGQNAPCVDLIKRLEEAGGTGRGNLRPDELSQEQKQPDDAVTASSALHDGPDANGSLAPHGGR